MANIIKVPYKDLEKAPNKDKPVADKESIKKILYKKIFQMAVVLIRKKFAIPFQYVEEPEELIVSNNEILLENDLDNVVRSLAFSFGLSDRWFYTLKTFVVSEKLILPEDDDLVNVNNPSSELPMLIYKNNKLVVTLEEDDLIAGIIKPRLLVELKGDTTKEDIVKAFKHINVAQKKYLKKKTVKYNTSVPYEVLNYVFNRSKLEVESNQDIIDEVGKKFDLRLGLNADDICKIRKQAEELGF